MKHSHTVAHEFLGLAGEKGQTLTLMQLLKLVYIAHGWMLALYRRPLVKDEIQAWRYGPVVPGLYDKIRHFRGGPVLEVEPEAGEALDERERALVRQVFDSYGHCSGLTLSSITHTENSPWALTYDGSNFGEVIPNDLIQDYYIRLGKARRPNPGHQQGVGR